MKPILFASLALVGAVCSACPPLKGSDELGQGFANPPDACRPWVYWFWLNGNVTKEGITADLTAMKQTGIGGVLIMETDQGAPLGQVPFAGPKWREMFHRVVTEANRLGLQVNMNDDAGWAGSGGPWITPERSMQKVVWSEAVVEGPTRLVQRLDLPPMNAGFYRDIAVEAIPTVSGFRIPDIAGKAAFIRRDAPPSISYETAPIDAVVGPRSVINLSSQVTAQGVLTWNVPPGKWTIFRFGHTSTGVTNEPSPLSGLGLECDKLSKEGSEAAFHGFMGKLVDDSGPLTGKTFVRMHIDSWEVGSQNWTEKFRNEFLKRRRYDLLPYLPVFTGRVVGSLEQSERFLWDLRQTVSDLLLVNYERHMAELAAKHGIRLSTEAYGDMTMDDLAYGGRADEPMGEFWTWNGDITNPKGRFDPSVVEMVSSAHVYGKHVVGAESFTSDDSERWRYYPGSIKAMGDLQLSRGINRFVVHRYAMQPWLNVRPGMSMGPWGLHYERTNTWWGLSGPWHKYLARCQYMLQKGLPVVDLLYLAPEGAPSSFIPPKDAIDGPYRGDACPPDAFMSRARVLNHRIVFPDGMSYRALVLPSAPMTPQLLRRIKDFVDHGAIVFGGTRPFKSPSLSEYPNCDAEVQNLARVLWGNGKIRPTPSIQQVLGSMSIPPDFEGDPRLSVAHRSLAETEIYFVANTCSRATNSICRFRVTGGQPGLWDPETGNLAPIPNFIEKKGVISIPLSFGAGDSVFVVFGKTRLIPDPISRFTHFGADVMKAATRAKIHVNRAMWGPAGDPARTKDVRTQVQRIIDHGSTSFQVAELASEGDPALNIVKTLRVEYTADGKSQSATAADPETISFSQQPDPSPKARIELTGNRISIVAKSPGAFEVQTHSGKELRAIVKTIPKPVVLSGRWKVQFPPAIGAPTFALNADLKSWTEWTNPGIMHFSGTAKYTKTFDVANSMVGKSLRQWLDLGTVDVMAQVRVNDKDLGILWRPPYRIEVTSALKVGLNSLEIRVTNLWPNRMIGDESLQEDADRNPNGTLRSWPDWVLSGGKSPTGRIDFTSWKLWHKKDALLPSGLMGPVTIQSEAVAVLHPYSGVRRSLIRSEKTRPSP